MNFWNFCVPCRDGAVFLEDGNNQEETNWRFEWRHLEAICGRKKTWKRKPNWQSSNYSDSRQSTHSRYLILKLFETDCFCFVITQLFFVDISIHLTGILIVVGVLLGRKVLNATFSLALTQMEVPGFFWIIPAILFRILIEDLQHLLISIRNLLESTEVSEIFSLREACYIR